MFSQMVTTFLSLIKKLPQGAEMYNCVRMNNFTFTEYSGVNYHMCVFWRVQMVLTRNNFTTHKTMLSTWIE